MARYIDAERLCNGLREMASVQYPDRQNAILGVISTIENMPTADVEEVRHGEWMKEGCCFYCSECKKTYGLGSTQTIYDVKRHWLHCPNCGTRMGGKNENV